MKDVTTANWYLYHIGFQSTPAYTNTARSCDDKVHHQHNHISSGTSHQNSLHCKPPDMHLPGSLVSTGTSQRLDHMIHYHGNILDMAGHSWHRLGRIAIPANLDRKCSFLIQGHMIH